MSEPTTRQIRSWLRQNRRDIPVGTRGFLSREAREAYDAAHTDVPAAQLTIEDAR